MIFRSLPIDGPLRITSHFGPRNTGIKGASTYHQGIDLGRDFSKLQTAVLAVHGGTVSANYWNKYRGWVVVIQHNGVWSTLYQHLAEKSPRGVGQTVKAGETIGVMGNSSDKAVLQVAVHLHFELRKNGTPINPERYLKNIQKEGLDMTKQELEQLIEEKINKKLSGEGQEPSNWAKKSWAQATAEGIVDGSRPKGYTTREQVAQMILNGRK